MTFEDRVDEQINRIVKFFRPRLGHASEFFGPVISGIVGCAVFAVFDKFGVGNLAAGGSAHSFIDEVSKSLLSPYFLIGMLALALGAMVETSDGTGFFGRWVVGPFLRLCEHFSILGLGVFLALAACELVTDFAWTKIGQIAIVSSILIFQAACFTIGARYFKGDYAAQMKGKPFRRAVLFLIGGILLVAGAIDAAHYAKKHAGDTKPTEQLSAPACPASAAPAAPAGSAASSSTTATAAPSSKANFSKK